MLDRIRFGVRVKVVELGTENHKMKYLKYPLAVLLLLCGCAGITPINDMPHIALGEASFYPTLSAHTDASIISGNRVELLFNGDQIFPAILGAIRSAEKSI